MMDREFVYRQVLVWLEMEFGLTGPTLNTSTESLTNHLVNNWEMVERAKMAEQVKKRLSGVYYNAPE